MAWISGFVQFDIPSEQQHHFESNILITKVNELVFYGVVMESKSKKPVPGALVNVFARVNDGKEEPLCYSYSGGDGHYLLHVDKGKIPAGTTAIIVRSSSSSHSSGGG